MFQKCFDEVAVLQFCWCEDLIAATQEEGGLVSVQCPPQYTFLYFFVFCAFATLRYVLDSKQS